MIQKSLIKTCPFTSTRPHCILKRSSKKPVICRASAFQQLSRTAVLEMDKKYINKSLICSIHAILLISRFFFLLSTMPSSQQKRNVRVGKVLFNFSHARGKKSRRFANGRPESLRASLLRCQRGCAATKATNGSRLNAHKRPLWEEMEINAGVTQGGKYLSRY